MEHYEPFGGREPGTPNTDRDDGSSGIVAPFLSLGGGTANGDGSGDNSGSGSGGTDGLGTGERFDPTIHVSPDKRNADGRYTKKRGRKAGGSSSATGSRGSGRTSEASYKAGVDTLATCLMIVHAGIASVSKTPELALEEDEADSLAKATANVLQEFDIAPNPKVQAVVGLVVTSGTIYGSKIYLIRERKKEERNERQTES